EHLADRLLREIEQARTVGRRFVLGCPTGRTPRPTYSAIARRLATEPRDLRHLTLVMMDEYAIENGDRFQRASPDKPWSCHHFARREILDSWNEHLPEEFQISPSNLWFPEAEKPETYDARIESMGGIDFFILASGASDGHVAFNTFPAFGTIEAVPRYGISAGIATIAAARNAVMILTGPAKRDSFARVVEADQYDLAWPATIIHEFSTGAILADREAASTLE
ncbi:MAG: hypothetical protein AUG20_02125, partial [Gemmatimonas sp. 13_1_20CM_3_60_15]